MRFMKKAMAVLTALVMGFGTAAVPIQAESLGSNGATGYWFYGPGLFTTGNWANSGSIEKNTMYTYNGIPSYCVEPKVEAIMGSDIYFTSTLEDSNFQNDAIRQQITKITYFGYGYDGHDSEAWYAATQKAVWSALDPSYAGITAYYKAPGAGTDMIYPDDPASYDFEATVDINAKVQAINELVAAYDAGNVKPDFVIKDQNGNTVGTSGQNAYFDKALIGRTYTITDVSGGLTLKDVTLNDFGANAVVSGNTITVTMAASDLNVDHQIKFATKGSYFRIQSKPIILATDDPRSQTVVSPGHLDPYQGAIALKGFGYKLRLHKADAQGVSEQGNAAPFTDITYDIKNKATGIDAGTLTVGENGDSNIIEGLAPDTYTYTETRTVDGYMQTSDPIEFTISDADYVIQATDEVIRAPFTLHKKDIANGTAEGDGNLQCSFELYNRSKNAVVVNGERIGSNGRIGTYTTDTDGNFNSADQNIYLPYGNYEIKEIDPPAGYLADPATDTLDITFTVSSPGPVSASDLSNTIKRGGFKVQKKDTVTGAQAQGDTDLTMTFELYNRSEHEVLVNGQKYAKDVKIATYTTNTNGAFQSSDNLLPYGTYELVETAAPVGYTGKTEPTNILTSTFSIREPGITEAPAIVNRPDVGRLSIFKTIAKEGGTSSFADPEPNATFAALLMSKIKDSDGDGEITVKDARLQLLDQAAFLPYEHSTFTTDENGTGISGYLAYGKYMVFQTASGDPEYRMTDQTAIFIVDSDRISETPKTYYVTNQPVPYWLAIQKIDSQTGKAVTYNSAEFKIKQLTDKDGNAVNEYVRQKVNDKWYDTFRTTSDNATSDRIGASTFVAAVSNDPAENTSNQKGEVTAPLQLYAGTYLLEETKVPAGFIKMGPKQFTIDVNAIYIKDDDGDRIITVTEDDQQITASLTIDKSIAAQSADLSLLNRNDLSSFGFTLTADEDIINPDDGTVIIKAGEAAKNIYGETVGIFNVDKLGNAVIEEIPLGKYTLRETSQMPGTVTNHAEYHYDFEQKTTGGILGFGAHLDTEKNDYDQDSMGNPTITASEKIVNQQTILDVSKKKATDGEELPGAKLTLTTKDGSIVAQWISTDKEYRIEGLVANETYTLTETITPRDENGADLGYARASSIDLVVRDDNTVQHVSMADKFVTLTKEDENGKEAPGALITVTDKDGNTVDNWTSTTEAHKIKNLEVGQTYTITETSAPDGYYYAASTTFTVKDDGIDQAEKLIDNMIHYQIAKVDDNGNYVKGVTLKLTDTTAVTEVTLPNNGITTDKPFELDGKLIAGHKYLLEESEYVAGVYKATSVEFEVAKTGTADVTTITMKDLTTNIAIQKVDNHGNPVAGAKLQILETATDKDGNIVPAADKDGKAIIVKEYTSTSDAAGIDISKDVMGDKTYILRELEAPFGFDLSKDVTFTVTGTKEKAQVIMMTDVRKTYYVSAVKVDAQDQTKLLPGAEITLFLKDGTVAKDINGNDCKGTTDGQGVITWNVEYNGDLGGYYVQETAVPQGYRINSNHYDVTLSEDYDFAKDNAVKIVVNDEAAPIDEGSSPDTGDKTAPIVWGITGAASMFVVIAILVYRRRKHRMD